MNSAEKYRHIIEQTCKNIKVHQYKSKKTKKIIAVDSGFNSAYESNFYLFKAAVVNENIDVTRKIEAFFFHTDNYQISRLRRILLQQSLFQSLVYYIEKRSCDNFLILVDGTISLSIFYPTLKDNDEYRKHFENFYNNIYSPLIKKCIKHDMILLGFLKRTGSTYLAESCGVNNIYDIQIIRSLLKKNGMYIPPIPIIDSQAKVFNVKEKFVTFFLNLKSWPYRFELLREQKEKYGYCIENLLYWASDAYFGMNPIFSKADEYARVTKREANLMFNVILYDLPKSERSKILINSRKKTHFGYNSSKFIRI
jgi:hypothetical protein